VKKKSLAPEVWISFRGEADDCAGEKIPNSSRQKETMRNLTTVHGFSTLRLLQKEKRSLRRARPIKPARDALRRSLLSQRNALKRPRP